MRFKKSKNIKIGNVDVNNLSFLQNVLRELEQKKPQLDDLVRTAESLRESPIKQQIPAKGIASHFKIFFFYFLLENDMFCTSHAKDLYHIRACLKGTWFCFDKNNFPFNCFPFNFLSVIAKTSVKASLVSKIFHQMDITCFLYPSKDVY